MNAVIKKGDVARQEKPQGAVAMLIADHKAVKALFAKFAALQSKRGSDKAKTEIVAAICSALTVHAQLEEELFYPAVRAAIDADDLMDEAQVEHASAKELIAQLSGMDPDDDLYDAKVTVLGEQIEHHVREEEGEMFPKAKRAKVDTIDLGLQMAKRREQLQARSEKPAGRR